MKKALTIIFCIIGGIIIAPFALLFIFIIGYFAFLFVSNSYHESIAQSPSRIAKVAHYKLPKYTIIEYDDNLDRTSSSWNNYTYLIKFKEPLSQKEINKLDNLVSEYPEWEYNEDKHEYVHVDEATVVIHLEDNTAKIEYFFQNGFD